MKSSRLLSILLLLQARGQQSADQLAEELEVSPRTIHRDMDQLSYAGVPVYAERGRHGGYRLLDGYQTRLTGLDADEASSLLLSGLGGSLGDLGLGQAAQQGMLKVLAALPAQTRDQASVVSERFYLDPLSWYRQKEDTPFLRPAATAVWAQQRVVITYASWSGLVERSIEPLAIVLKAGSWYLVAQVEDTRVYKVANIRSLDMLEDRFTRPEAFDLQQFWMGWLADFERRLKTQTVTLRASAEGLRLLAERGHTPQPPIATTERDGWQKVSLRMEAGTQTLRDILALGAEAQVLAPLALRDEVANELRKMQAHYHGTS